MGTQAIKRRLDRLMNFAGGPPRLPIRPFLGLLSTVFATPDGGLDYSRLWSTLAVVGLLTSLAFAALFRDETQVVSEKLDGV